MSNVIVVGAYWGDEGKGKIVDFLSADVEWVVRYNGGDNAGHTIVLDGRAFPLHAVPSGVFHGKKLGMSPGVLVNPETLMREITMLSEAGYLPQLCVDSRVNVIMPYHVALDAGRETAGKGVGSTKRGIGPCMEDAARRNTAVTMGMLAGEAWEADVRRVVQLKEDELRKAGVLSDVEGYVQELTAQWENVRRQLTPYVVDDVAYRLKAAKGILLEGAQGTLLDRDHGTKPHQTSTNTTALAGFASAGVDGRTFRKLLVVKAYPSRVGGGPFPTRLGTPEQVAEEDRNEPVTETEIRKAKEGDAYLLGRWIRKRGREYGTTTGRAREVGYPDLVALRYAAVINGMTRSDGLAVTLADVLGGIPLKLATAYEKDGKQRTTFPAQLDGWMPVYGAHAAWPELSSAEVQRICAEGYGALPGGLKEYCRQLVVFTGVPVELISLGPDRKETLVKGVREATEAYLQ